MKYALRGLAIIVFGVFVYFLGIYLKWWKNPWAKDVPYTDIPIKCDPARPGYRKDGVKDSDCGTVPCDPNRPGYDTNGFPDVSCGFGRQQQN